MILRVWILGILLIVLLWYIWNAQKEGFNVARTTYVLPTPLNSDRTRANFLSIVEQQKVWNAGKGKFFSSLLKGTGSGSGSDSGSGSGSGSRAMTTQQLLKAVTHPGPGDTFNVTFPNYISIYALAKYNMDPVAARYALGQNYDTLQDEVVNVVPTAAELAAQGSFTAAPQASACAELNALAMSLYGRVIAITAAVTDLSGTEITAEALHAESLGFQGSSVCMGQGATPSVACMRLAIQDEKLFPILHNYDEANTSLLTNGQTVQDMLNLVLQAYNGLGCTMPTGSTPSISSVFSQTYLDSLGTINTEALSLKLQELSPYYVSPTIINYITKQIIATSQFNTNIQNATDYVANMSKVTNAIVNLAPGMPIASGSTYVEGGSTGVGIMTCPAGYMCPPTASAPIPCPVGSYCPPGTTETPPKCPSGTFSPLGSTSRSQCTTNMPLGYYPKAGVATICPKGAYCPANTTEPVSCPKGTYNSVKGKSSALEACINCPAGSYCPLQTNGYGASYPTPCGVGTYSSVTMADASGVCMKCPGGTTCPSKGMSVATPCPAGTYSSAIGLTTACTPLPAGMYSLARGLLTAALGGSGSSANSPQACEAGYYCAGGNSSQTPCPQGYYCPTPSLTAAIACPSGRYGDLVGQTASTCSGQCTAGYFCPLGSISPTQGGCPEGYYCPAGTPNPVICPRGHFCPFQSVAPLKCPIGTYNSLTGKPSMTDCMPCTPGGYCDVTGLPEPKPCPLGNYCPTGIGMPTPCPAGTYCDATGMLSPRGCPAGTYGPNASTTSMVGCLACAPGTYNSSSGQTACLGQCQVGYYCPKSISCIQYTPPSSGSASSMVTVTIGTVYQIPCPVGTYCPTTNRSAPLQCPAGTYGSATGLSVAGCSGQCAAGYYCPAGSIGQYGLNAATASTSSTQCPPGYYCPPGSAAPVPCPAGTRSTTVGAISQLYCTPCPAGTFCPSPGAITIPSDCPAGTVCAGSGASAPTPCPPGRICSGGSTSVGTPPGTFSPQGGSSSSVCPPGTYCPGGGGNPITCPAGYSCPAAGGSSTQICPAGTFSPAGATNCSPCTAGRYCPTAGTGTPILCAAGTFSAAGALICTPCAAGTYSPAGSTACTTTPPNTYSASGAGTYTLTPAGNYSAAGAATYTAIPSGYYGSGAGAGSSPCPAGYSCPGGTTIQICPAGRYSPAGATTCMICPAGTYSSAGAGACTTSPPNTYSSSGAGTYTLTPAGNYSAAGAGTYTAIPSGYYGSGAGAGSSPCPAGYSCPGGTVTQICPAGRYSPAGSTTCMICPAGTYSSAGAGACTTTPPNTYSGSGAGTYIQVPPGAYSGSGAGTYISISAPGYYSLSGIGAGSAACTAGYSCAGDGTRQICAAGTYSPAGVTTCIPCPTGTYGSTTGLTTAACSGTCPPGLNCPPGTITGTPCQAGYYCPGVIVQPPLTTIPNLTGVISVALNGSDLYYTIPNSIRKISNIYSSTTQASGFSSTLFVGGLSNSPVIKIRSNIIYIADGSNGIKRCDMNGNVTIILVVNPSFGIGSILDLVLNSTGTTIYFIENRFRYVCSINSSLINGANTSALTVATGFSNFKGIAINSNNLLYVSDNATVKSVTTGGVVTTIAGGSNTGSNDGPGATARFGSNIGGLLVDMNNDILVADFGNNKIRKISNGVVSTVAGTGTAGSSDGSLLNTEFNGPRFLALDSINGIVHVADTNNNSIRMIMGLCPSINMYSYMNILPIACPVGTFNNSTGQVSCVNCPAGTASTSTAATSISACNTCPAGRYSGSGASECAVCPAGYSCTGGAIEICRAGTYSPAGATTCSQCPAGTYSPNTGASNIAACLANPANTYSQSGAGSYILNPPGAYSGSRAGTYTMAAPGYFGSQLGAGTSQCPGGYYCSGGAAIEACPPRTFSPLGSRTCSQCNAGYYCGRATPSLTSANLCPAGYYCPIGTGTFSQINVSLILETERKTTYTYPLSLIINNNILYYITSNAEAPGFSVFKASSNVPGSPIESIITNVNSVPSISSSGNSGNYSQNTSITQIYSFSGAYNYAVLGFNSNKIYIVRDGSINIYNILTNTTTAFPTTGVLFGISSDNMAFDSNNNLYIGSSENNSANIIMINQSGVASIFVGGSSSANKLTNLSAYNNGSSVSGSSILLSKITSLTIDSNNNIYAVDNFKSIYYITPSKILTIYCQYNALNVSVSSILFTNMGIIVNTPSGPSTIVRNSSGLNAVSLNYTNSNFNVSSKMAIDNINNIIYGIIVRFSELKYYSTIISFPLASLVGNFNTSGSSASIANYTGPIPCPAGTYSSSLGRSALTSCLTCPAGKASIPGSKVCI